MCGEVQVVKVKSFDRMRSQRDREKKMEEKEKYVI